MTHRLDLIYIPINFHEDIPNGYRVVGVLSNIHFHKISSRYVEDCLGTDRQRNAEIRPFFFKTEYKKGHNSIKICERSPYSDLTCI